MFYYLSGMHFAFAVTLFLPYYHFTYLFPSGNIGAMDIEQNVNVSQQYVHERPANSLVLIKTLRLAQTNPLHLFYSWLEFWAFKKAMYALHVTVQNSGSPNNLQIFAWPFPDLRVAQKWRNRPNRCFNFSYLFSSKVQCQCCYNFLSTAKTEKRSPRHRLTYLRK